MASTARSHLAKPPRGQQRAFSAALHADEQLQAGTTAASRIGQLAPAPHGCSAPREWGGPEEPQLLDGAGPACSLHPLCHHPCGDRVRVQGGLTFPKALSPGPVGLLPKGHWLGAARVPHGKACPWHCNRPFPSMPQSDEDAAETSCFFLGWEKLPGTYAPLQPPRLQVGFHLSAFCSPPRRRRASLRLGSKRMSSCAWCMVQHPGTAKRQVARPGPSGGTWRRCSEDATSPSLSLCPRGALPRPPQAHRPRQRGGSHSPPPPVSTGTVFNKKRGIF